MGMPENETSHWHHHYQQHHNHYKNHHQNHQNHHQNINKITKIIIKIIIMQPCGCQRMKQPNLKWHATKFTLSSYLYISIRQSLYIVVYSQTNVSTFPDRSHLYIAQTLGVLAPCYSHHFSRLQCSFQCTVVYDTCFIVCDVHPMCTHHALQCAMFCAPWVAQLYDASSHVSLSVMRKTQCIFHNVHVQCTMCIAMCSVVCPTL